jgi:hypothetical protein
MYSINGKQFKELFGSRQQVMNGTAYKTAGELTKSHLMMNKWGRIVSRKKHATAKKEKRLLKHGFTAKKGKFGVIKIGKKTKNGRKSRKMSGGGELEDAQAALTTANALDDNVADKQDKINAAQAQIDAAQTRLAAAQASAPAPAPAPAPESASAPP